MYCNYQRFLRGKFLQFGLFQLFEGENSMNCRELSGTPSDKILLVNFLRVKFSQIAIDL